LLGAPRGYLKDHGQYWPGTPVDTKPDASEYPPALRDIAPWTPEPLPDLPPMPNLTEHYVERPLSLYIPVEIQQHLPDVVNDYIPPPVPPMPAFTLLTFTLPAL